MSYYRYITGVYKSYWPELNRTLRSSSVPRHVPQLETARYTRSTSVPPSSRFSSCHAATPFRDRATSVPPARERLHYTDFDYKVIDYMGRLSREDAVKTTVSQARTNRNSNNFSYRYNFYDSEKHNNDYLYPSSKDIFGRWKHFSLSNQTLNERNDRAASPLVSRELNRYYGTQKRTSFLGDLSSGGVADFRHYNYRRVPYMGGSDEYKYMQCKPFRKNSNGNGNGNGGRGM